MSDTQTISAVLTGDRERFQELVERHKKLVYAIAWSQLGNSELSEDAAQETFLKAFLYLRTLRDPNRFDSWIAKIARTVCWTFRRKASREGAALKSWATDQTQSQAASSDDRRETLEDQLWQSFAALPDTHREALTVFYLEGKSVREAAELLGIGEAAMKVRLHRARTALREHIESRLEESLDRLQPSARFTGSVMAMLPLSPGGGLGAAGLFGAIGKLAMGASFTLWMILVPIAFVVGASFLFSKLDSAAIRDLPQNQFRKKLVRQQYVYLAIAMVAMMGIMVISMRLLSHRFGSEIGATILMNKLHGQWLFRGFFALLAVVYIPLFWLTLKTLRVNRSAIAWWSAAMVVAWFAGLIATACGAQIDSRYCLTGMFVIIVPYYWFSKGTEMRRDNNLFLRCAIGGLRTEIGSETKEPLQLTDPQLRAFARSLGDQWLVRDYRLTPDRIILFLPKLFGKSNVQIDRSGKCVAEVDSADLRAIRRVTGRNVDRTELQHGVERAVQSAVVLFAAGDADGSLSVLAAHSDESILDAKGVERKRRVWVAYIVGFIIFIWTGLSYIDARKAEVARMQTNDARIQAGIARSKAQTAELRANRKVPDVTELPK